MLAELILPAPPRRWPPSCPPLGKREQLCNLLAVKECSLCQKEPHQSQRTSKQVHHHVAWVGETQDPPQREPRSVSGLENVGRERVDEIPEVGFGPLAHLYAIVIAERMTRRFHSHYDLSEIEGNKI